MVGTRGDLETRMLKTSLRIYRSAWMWILALIVVEMLGLSITSEPTLLGLGPNAWRMLDATFGNELREYPTWAYNILSFPDDIKKTTPYGLVLLWLYLSRQPVQQALKSIPRRWTSLLALTAVLIPLAVIAAYHKFNLYDSYHEHWVGESRRGLFSVFSWVSDSDGIGLGNLVGVFLYRLSYTLSIALMIHSGLFSLVVFSFALAAKGTAAAGPFIRKSFRWARAQRSREDIGPEGQWVHVFFFLLLFCLVAMSWMQLLQYEERWSSKQFRLGLAMLGLFVFPGLVYYVRLLRRRPWKVNKVLAGILAAAAMWALIVDQRAYTFVASNCYQDQYKRRDDRSEEHLRLVGKLASGMSTTYIESARMKDQTRLLWESLRVATKDDQKAVVIVYLVWASRLAQLSRMWECPRVVESPSEAQCELALAVERLGVLRRGGALNEQAPPPFSWQPDAGRGAPARWATRLEASARGIQGQLQGAPIANDIVRVLSGLDTDDSDIHGLLCGYNCLARSPTSVTPRSAVGRAVENFLHAGREDRVWRANSRRWEDLGYKPIISGDL